MHRGRYLTNSINMKNQVEKESPSPSEFADLAEQAIEDRRMELWEILDLRLTVKFAKRRGKVQRLDELILSYSGRPWSGPVVKMKEVPKKALKQGSLL